MNAWTIGCCCDGGSDTATIPGCVCAAIPSTLHLTSTVECGPLTFPACTLVYGPTPPELSGLDLTANCFLSSETFTDPDTGLNWRFHLGCSTIFMRLSRVYLPSDEGSAFHDATIYTWSIGQPGNTCSPFLLSSADSLSGGNPGCLVTVQP